MTFREISVYVPALIYYFETKRWVTHIINTLKCFVWLYPCICRTIAQNYIDNLRAKNRPGKRVFEDYMEYDEVWHCTFVVILLICHTSDDHELQKQVTMHVKMVKVNNHKPVSFPPPYLLWTIIQVESTGLSNRTPRCETHKLVWVAVYLM